MSKFFKTTLFFISVMFFASCSSDDNSSPSTDDDSGPETPTTFVINGQTFETFIGVMQIFHDPEQGISDASITITGYNGENYGIIGFNVFYNTSEGIGGVYNSDENNNEEETIAGTYSAWMSSYSIQDEDDNYLEHSNLPIGSVKITSHGNNIFTLEFDVEYTNGVNAVGNVKRMFIIQGGLS